MIKRQIISSMATTDIKKIAFCCELDKKITAAEVWELAFGKNIQRYSLNRLSFCCPNKNCNARLILRNCFHLYAPEIAQFRLYRGQQHELGCPYIRKRVYQRKADRLQEIMRLNDRESIRHSAVF